jgi:hypothetical protein
MVITEKIIIIIIAIKMNNHEQVDVNKSNDKNNNHDNITKIVMYTIVHGGNS